MEEQDIGQGGWLPFAGGEPVTRLLVASRSDIAGPVYAQMERIRGSAVRYNEPAGVATALLHQSGWFVQWKEGPAEAVQRIIERVATDYRHHAMQVVHASIGPRQLSGPWSMAIVQCDDQPDAMGARVECLRAAHARGAQASPAAAWRQLSTPLQHPGALRQADPDAFQRVLVCAAAGWGSFDLVEWLARLHGQEVVHRRFAGARELDVGTDLVDFADGERTVRVIAMARKGLLLPLTRAFLADYSHVLLLLCGDAARDLALLRKVGLACAALPQAPVVLAVAAEALSHAAPRAIAQRRGLAYRRVEADPESPAAVWAAVQPELASWCALRASRMGDPEREA
jgi:hypothetical protein